MRKSVILILVLCIFLPVHAAKFDVKSRMTKKGSDVTVFKNTIIEFLKLKGHKIKELGEDYSIFLDDFQVLPSGNKLRVIVQGEIGEPSLFGKGKILKEIKIDKVYDTKRIADPKKWTIEDRAKFEELDQAATKGLGKGEIGVKIAETAANFGIPGMGTAARSLLDFVGVKVDDKLDNHIMLGAFLAGTDVVKDIETFLK